MIKKGLSLLLSILFILPLLASCQKTPAGSDDGKDPYSPFNPDINRDEWQLPENSSVPDPTPAKDPANGVKVSYLCQPSHAGTIDGKGA